jgi:hypothetical protein
MRFDSEKVENGGNEAKVDLHHHRLCNIVSRLHQR